MKEGFVQEAIAAPCNALRVGLHSAVRLVSEESGQSKRMKEAHNPPLYFLYPGSCGYRKKPSLLCDCTAQTKSSFPSCR